MKFIFNMIILTSLSMNLLFAGKAVKAGEDRSLALAANVTLDPSTGEKVFTNQLMLAFKSSISGEEREIILDEQDFKVLSSSPSLNIYHVAFANPEASFTKLLQIRDNLRKNPKILYVYLHRSLQSNHSSISFLKDNNLRRKGEITLSDTDGYIKPKPKTVNEVINRHQGALSSCVERKRRLLKKYHGTIAFRVDISPSGQVAQARITKSSIKDKKLTSCFLNKIRNWRDFPANSGRRGNRTVNFSFDF
jgi:TonB family protein